MSRETRTEKPQTKRRLSSDAGVTLFEVTLAVAIFFVTVGVAAQSLVSFYAHMDMQNQRVIAVNHCQSVLSAMRNLRDASPNSAENPSHFQEAILAAYPSGTEKDGPGALKGAKVKVTYDDPRATVNPLTPTVTLWWQDLRGHPCTVALSSAITDR
jgi:type II secretory pathway pseudopilin PulG